MSDNAAAALKTSKLIVEHVVSEVNDIIMEANEGMTNEDLTIYRTSFGKG